MTQGGYVYILASRPNGTLYIGVTSELVRRVGQHRSGETGGFVSEHGVHRLIYFERHEDIRDAIERENRLKKWNRAWKLNLIRATNPDERDLFDEVASHPGVPLAMPEVPMDSRLRGNDGVGSGLLGLVIGALLLISSPVVAQETPAESPDGNALVQAWRDAATRGDAPAQAGALRRLEALHFWTPPVVALARWTLGAVPPDAVLLAQTDGDAVPLAILQTAFGLRPDVTVVHAGLLGDVRYARAFYESDSLTVPDPLVEDDTDATTRRDGLVAEWAAEALAGGRPLAGTLTLDPQVLGRVGPVVLAGAYQRPGTPDESSFDLTAAEASADAARGADFVGPRVSAADTDPARRASPVDLGGVVLFNLLQTAVSHAQAGDAAAAERAYARARTFAAEALIDDDPLVGIAREWIDDALAAPPAAGPSRQP